MSSQARQPAARARKLVQLTLDLFGPAPAGNADSAVKLPGLVQKVPFAQAGKGQAAIETVATPVSPVLAAFRHPRATREILLDGRLVAYEVRRRKRRTIGFSVGAEGLAVSAPKWVPLYEIDQAVQGKSGWILKKLHETRERRRQLESVRIDWKDGATFPFLGEPLRVVLDARQAHAALEPDAGNDATARTLRLRLPPDAAPGLIQQAVQAWLMQQARQLFTARLDHFSLQLNVQWRKLSLSSAATRWGSASSSGAIRLNWRLMHFRPAVIDYVVVHELSHLRFMDHSPRFWATVHHVMPDHAALRRQLKDEVIPRW
ncbi:MAG: M48 family metallopeptidase [Burkholderiales bacterium]|nr:M48 family metallopeptidase [Burkholderiales bacterium]